MISTYTISDPQIFRSNPSNRWAAVVIAPLVVSVLGAMMLDWTGHQMTGLLTVGWGLSSLFFFKWRKKNPPVKLLADCNLHFKTETIEIDSHTYNVAKLRNLRLNVGHYDGESTTPHKGVQVALEGLQVFTGGPAIKGNFYDGSDSQLSFLDGNTKISLSFYIGSEVQRSQFSTLLKTWYAAGIPVQELSNGLRTYLGKQLNYAQVQEFKAQWETGKQVKFAGR